jgi:hypothetical protein
MIRFRIFFFLNCLVFSCAENDWYRKLPQKKDKVNIDGVWERKIQSRSAQTSNWHRETGKEWIEFNQPSPGMFTKTSVRKNFYGSEVVTDTIVGRGIFSVSGNWVLFTTQEIKIIHKEIDKTCCNEYKKYEHRLLYYYDTVNLLIIPMKYEFGYQEYDFGVIDGVTNPYDENDKNFQLYVKIYSFKEFHSHAYFKSVN